MKKILIAFSVTIVLAIVVYVGIGLKGCDQFNSILGKPNKSEIDAREKADRERERFDSIKKAEQAKFEALMAQDKEDAAAETSKPFRIIVGAFEEYQNADRMTDFYRAKGFNPEMFDYGGLRHVSAVSFETFAEAERALENLLDTDYCEEAWIFKRK